MLHGADWRESHVVQRVVVDALYIMLFSANATTWDQRWNPVALKTVRKKHYVIAVGRNPN